jgi:putative toxin-antitoxin system antitoxin component (TIGR02293 family)
MATQANLPSFIGVTPHSDFNLAEMVEAGLSLDSLGGLREAGLTYSEISDLVISPRTLKHRRSRGEPLSSQETDRLVRVARIVALAETVFGNREKALLWLRSPDDRIASRSPMSLLQTESGGRLVETMLWQLDEGVYT